MRLVARCSTRSNPDSHRFSLASSRSRLGKVESYSLSLHPKRGDMPAASQPNGGCEPRPPHIGLHQTLSGHDGCFTTTTPTEPPPLSRHQSRKTTALIEPICYQSRTPFFVTEKVRVEEPRKPTGRAHVQQDAASFASYSASWNAESAAPAARAGDADDAEHMSRRRSAAAHPAHPERYDYRRHGTDCGLNSEPL